MVIMSELCTTLYDLLILTAIDSQFCLPKFTLSNVMYMYQFICKMKFLISKLVNVLSIFGSENRHFECFLGGYLSFN